MTTQVEETKTHYIVSTIQTVGRERRRPRLHVHIQKGDMAELKKEVEKQVKAAHVRAGLTTE